MKDILFDLDGTITDPMLGITKSVAYALKYFEIEVKDLKESHPLYRTTFSGLVSRVLSLQQRTS